MKISANFRYVLFIVICFGMADFILARIFIERPPLESGIREHHPYYHHGFRSNAEMETSWGGNEYTIHTNSLGFKDRTVREIPLVSENHRIVFIGDSFTEGIGLHYEDTFVGIIDEREAGKGYEVFNAGVASYSPKLYYLKTKYLLEAVGFHFDEMYVCLDISDIRDEVVYEDFGPEEDQPQMDIRKAKRNIYYKDLVKNYLVRNSVAGHLIFGGQSTLKINRRSNHGNTGDSVRNAVSNDPYIERDLWVYNDSLWTSWGSKGLDLADQYMVKLHELCLQHDIDVTLVIYPKPTTIEAGETSTRHTRHWLEFAASNGIAFIDVTPDFLELGNATSVISTYFIPGDVHFNRPGNEVMAKAIQLD